MTVDRDMRAGRESIRDLLAEAHGYAVAYLEDVVNRHVGGTVRLDGIPESYVIAGLT